MGGQWALHVSLGACCCCQMGLHSLPGPAADDDGGGYDVLGDTQEAAAAVLHAGAPAGNVAVQVDQDAAQEPQEG